MAERRRSIHTGHRQRVKDEFSARGLAGWPDHRVLELLLYYAIPQGDVNGLAHELVERFGSLAGVLDAAEEELCRVPGVGQHTAVLLKLIPAAGARYLQSRADLGEPVRRTEDAYALLEPYFFGARNEMIYLLALDGKNKPLGVRKVAEGSICAANINLRRIMEEAAALRAPQIYLAHNHISNLAFPSPVDISTTQTMRTALAGAASAPPTSICAGSWRRQPPSGRPRSIWPTTTSATWPSPPRWTSPQLRPCGRPWRGWASSCWITWSLWTGIWCPCGTAG